ncbi:MAG: DNA mismatch repair endonuclease MutL [Sedimentibacter saalensis]|jgi:DNA mismatch repair protein MutL|uniref:DNA mismatch repair endonuclease MutL n=1 Tax=Sedimentibacter saalensis TaxID=130788 RepID=UPI002B1FD3A3|nr:DNA mismatch repair endonuclease MutL [Sedimentibacter saalensis]MEA5094323.1 DNA mismatch repair endonuclease MutL [Sedimentibacter saalensis]
MAKIHLLDNETINKIAAGEVIESPKSIVKELVENSIDAKADEIIVEIKNGGKSLVRISDNGKGINKDEVEDAFRRHCTSKIESSDDLNSLFTLGFRGEALASIAAVAHVEVITRTANDDYGIKMSIEGGEIKLKEDVGCPVGTTITVTELFYNVPARKKFLKSDASESGGVNEVVVSLALSKQNISFKYVNNGSVAFRTPKTTNLLNTISSLYDKDLYNSLLKVEYEENNIKINGYTTNLNYYRGNRKQQVVFVNDRFIKHKRINYFIEAAYNTLLPKNKYPACFLKIEIDPSLVDVNVHPAKTEVRFQNEEFILNEVKRAIYKSLNSKSIMKEVTNDIYLREEHRATKEPSNNFSVFERINKDKTSLYDGTDYSDSSNYDNIKFKEVSFTDNNTVDIFENAIEEESSNHKYADLCHMDIFEENDHKQLDYAEDEISINTPMQHTFLEHEEQNEQKIPELVVVGIVMDTYIICENPEKNQMFMIDQHAAHERINYEKFLGQYNKNQIIRQELLVPEVVNLSYDDFCTASNNMEIFENLGFSVENFGINAILINNVPTIFVDSNIKDVFFTILDSLKDSGKSNLNLLLDKIIKNACVKSVKAGDRLHISEVRALLDNLKQTENPYTCPHGRPVIIKMTKYEIEKMFERIQS